MTHPIHIDQLYGVNRLLRILLVCGVVNSAATLVAAEVRGLLLDDDGRCVVRDFRQVALVRGEQEITLGGVPAEADLSTLQIWAPRAGVTLLDWFRLENEYAIRCRVRSTASRNRIGVDLIYLMTGLTWSAEYEVWIRSEMDKGGQPVSADLRGVVRIENGTRIHFSNAMIRLVGREIVTAHRNKPPGFLLLDRRTPLTDLWFPEPKEGGPPYDYVLDVRPNIPASALAVIPLVNRSRIPALRRYAMSSEEIPLHSKEYTPLREWITFPYAGARDRVAALPPGRVRVAVGPRKERIFDAYFQRALPGSEIRVDLGPSVDVFGMRARMDSTTRAGFRTETYELRIRNESTSKVVVEIEEQPPAPLGWTVIKATLPFEERNNRLFFQCAIDPGKGEQVQYSLKVREPRL